MANKQKKEETSNVSRVAKPLFGRNTAKYFINPVGFEPDTLYLQFSQPNQTLRYLTDQPDSKQGSYPKNKMEFHDFFVTFPDFNLDFS